MLRLLVLLAPLLLLAEPTYATPDTAPPFAITASSCVGCEDQFFDWADTYQFEASGVLGAQSFIWAAPNYATIGIRHMRLDFDGLGVAQLVTSTGSQRLVGPGTVCLAAYDYQRAFVLIRGFGEATARFEDGPQNGCLP